MTGAKDRALHAARTGKHGAFLMQRRVLDETRALRDEALRLSARARPYSFHLERYSDAAGFFPFDFFLHRDATARAAESTPVPRVVYACWTDSTPMSDNRVRCWEQFRRMNPDLEHVLVTEDNLDDHVVPGHPLHPSYASLSAVHRSDYLRSYLMHFHGGGYTDIKEATSSWNAAFDAVQRDPGVWLAGYPEVSSAIADNLHGPLRRDIKRHFSRLVGNGAFIVRPGTPLTAEWFHEVNRRLDYYSSDLAHFPAIDPFGAEGNYPVTWVGLLGLVLHPLQLKYLDHVRQCDDLTPSLSDFR